MWDSAGRRNDGAASGPRRPTRGRPLLAAAAAGALAAAAALPTVGYDFVWDDRLFLLGRETYRRFDLAGMFLGLGNGVEYLPVRDVTYAVDTFFWGRNPWGYHLANVLLYALQTALLVFVGRRVEECLMGRRSVFVPGLAAALFAVHPLHVEPVAFITGRNVVLSGFFLFLALDGYLRRPPRWLAAFAAFLLALLSKATTIFLPVWLVGHEFWLGGGRRAWRRLLLFLVAGAAAFVLFRTVAARTGIVDPGRTAAFGSLSVPSRLAVAGQIPFFYLAKFLWPCNLVPEYTPPLAATWEAPQVWAAWGVLLGVTALLLWARRRAPRLLWGWSWYLAALLPVSNLFATTPVVADRYAYLPLYGLTYGVAAAAARLPGRLRAVPSALVLLLLLGLTWRQNALWRNEETLWRGALARNPEALKARYNLAAFLLAAGREEEAWSLLRELRDRFADTGSLTYFRALAAYRRGDLEGTVRLVAPFVRHGGGTLAMVALLGRAYEGLGRPRAALEAYLQAVLRDGLDDEGVLPEVRRRLRRLQTELRRSLAPLETRVARYPEDRNARARLAVALDALGLWREARRHYRILEEQGGGSWSLYYNLGNVCRKLREYAAAVRYYRLSLARRWREPRTHNNLGVALKHLGRYRDAAASFRAALEVDPGFGKALFNLATLAFRRGRRAAAERLLREVLARFPEYRDRARFYLARLPR